MIGGLQLEPGNAPWWVTAVGVDVVKIQLLLDQGSGPVPVLNSTTNLNPGSVPANKWYQVANAYWDIQSLDGKTIIADHSVLSARLSAHILWYRPWPLPVADQGWCDIATDQAWVLTGIGTAGWDRAPAMYAVGETATANYQIPYVTEPQNGNGWDIRISSCAQNNKTVQGPTRLTQLQGSVQYVVQSADFNAAYPSNCLWVALRNLIWGKDFALAAAIDVINLAPTISVTGVSPQSPRQGQTVRIDFNATSNPTTKAPIKQIDIWYD